MLGGTLKRLGKGDKAEKAEGARGIKTVKVPRSHLIKQYEKSQVEQ